MKKYVVIYNYKHSNSCGWSKVKARTTQEAKNKVIRDHVPYDIEVTEIHEIKEG